MRSKGRFIASATASPRSTRTYYPFGHYEVSGSTVTKYYTFGGMRVAMKKGSTLTYLHTDHLGGTIYETNTAGDKTAEQMYCAYGKKRSGANCTTGNSLTTAPTGPPTFTGQKIDGTGLQYFNARYYDPVVGVFVSPDSIVPDAGSVFSYNRFMMVSGNPLRYNDPTGHCEKNANGSPDFSGDAECYKRAAEYYHTGPDSIRETYTDFANYNESFATAVSHEAFDTMLCAIWCNWYRERGLHHDRYNPPPTMNPVPEGANAQISLPTDPAVRAAIQVANTDCSQTDCVALTLDVVGVAGSGLMIASPICGPLALGCASIGRGISTGATIAGVGWTGYRAYDQGASFVDGVVVGVTATIGLKSSNPKVGAAAGSVQFVWDLFSGGVK